MKKSEARDPIRSDRATTQIATNLPIVQEDAATGPVAKSYAYHRALFGRTDVPDIQDRYPTVYLRTDSVPISQRRAPATLRCSTSE